MLAMKISVLKDFTRAPGPRYIFEGKNSGELFRENLLVPKLREAIARKTVLQIDLDGTAGYGTSFLEEVFGGLIREDKLEFSTIKRTLKFKSTEDPFLIEEIEEYLLDAREEAQEGKQEPA